MEEEKNLDVNQEKTLVPDMAQKEEMAGFVVETDTYKQAVRNEIEELEKSRELYKKRQDFKLLMEDNTLDKLENFRSVDKKRFNSIGELGKNLLGNLENTTEQDISNFMDRFELASDYNKMLKESASSRSPVFQREESRTHPKDTQDLFENEEYYRAKYPDIELPQKFFKTDRSFESRPVNMNSSEKRQLLNDYKSDLEKNSAYRDIHKIFFTEN